MYGKLLGSSRVTALRNRGRDRELRPRRDVHVLICSLHDVVDKDSSSGVNRLPLIFLFLTRQEARLREKRHGENILGIVGTLKWTKVRRSLTYLPLELFLWATKGLYQTVCVRSTSDDLFERADKLADQSLELHHRFDGLRIWEMRDIMIRVLEQSVEFFLQLGKPSDKELRVTINRNVWRTCLFEIKLDRTWPRRRVRLSVPKRRW